MITLSPITNNTKRSRFETEIDGEYAFVEYRFSKGYFVLMHTMVPEFARGRGIASILAKHALEYVKKNNLKLKVYCPVISNYIKQHPEYEYLVPRY